MLNSKPCDWLLICFCFQLGKSSFYWIVGDKSQKQNWKKLKCSDSSHSDLVNYNKLMTLLMTLVFNFRQVLCALTTLASNPAIQLVGAQCEKQRAKNKTFIARERKNACEQTLQKVIPPTYRPLTETRNMTASLWF